MEMNCSCSGVRAGGFPREELTVPSRTLLAVSNRGNLAGTRCGIKQRHAQPCVCDVCGAT